MMCEHIKGDRHSCGLIKHCNMRCSRQKNKEHGTQVMVLRYDMIVSSEV